MAEDDTTGKATRKPRPAAKPTAKAAAAPAPMAKTRAKGSAKAATESATGFEAETVAAPDVEAAKPLPSGLGPRGPLRLPPTKGLIGGLAAIAVLAAMVLAWPGARDRLAGMFSGPEPSAPVAAPKQPAAAAAPKLAAVAAPWARLADRLAALEESLTRLGADVAALKSAPPPAKEGDGAALKAVDDRLATLAESVKAIEGQVTKVAAPSEGSDTLALLALAGLLRQGAPFAPLAARVRGDLTDKGDGGGVTGALDGLAAYGAKGVPTRSALAAGLEALPLPAPTTDAPPARAAPKSEQPAGFWNKVWARVSKLVKIRRVGGEKTPASDAHTLAHATTAKALVMGDLAAADQASNGLAGPEAEAWRNDLRARIKADGLALALDGVIAARLAPNAGKP